MVAKGKSVSISFIICGQVCRIAFARFKVKIRQSVWPGNTE